jgi:hypothetical protein
MKEHPDARRAELREGSGTADTPDCAAAPAAGADPGCWASADTEAPVPSAMPVAAVAAVAVRKSLREAFGGFGVLLIAS